MKLYYSAGSCSTSCHITLEESGLPYEAIEVDFDQESDPNTQLVLKLNPLGTLPILITDDGKQLDQNAAIHTYIADLAPAKNLMAGPSGSFERAQALNWLSFVCSDLHKGVGGMFSLAGYADPAVKAVVREKLLATANQYLKYLDDKLAGKSYLMGDTFTAADAYAWVVTSWTQWLDVPLSPYANIEAYRARVAARPAVNRVLKAEGLLDA